MKAELFNYNCWVSLSDDQELKGELERLLVKCDYEILGFMEHRFKPIGYTAIWLLAESHLALHTFPEEAKAYVELTSCSEIKNLRFQDFLKGVVSLEKQHCRSI